MKWHCPICKKPSDSETGKDFPFCSERCRLTDLGNWASENYKVCESAADESQSGKSVSKSPESPTLDEQEN